MVAGLCSAERGRAPSTTLAYTFSIFTKKPLNSGVICVWIDHGWRQLIGQRLCRFAFIFCDAAEAPVNGDADLESFFAVDLHGLDAARDHGFGDVVGANA